jgi:hypothetical protein
MVTPTIHKVTSVFGFHNNASVSLGGRLRPRRVACRSLPRRREGARPCTWRGRHGSVLHRLLGTIIQQVSTDSVVRV